MGDRIRTVTVAVVLLAVLCGVGGAIVSFLVPDFSADINRVLVVRPPDQRGTGGMTWCQDCGGVGVADQFVAGTRLVLLGPLVAGIPLGICAMALTIGKRRAAFHQQCGNLLQIVFLVQLGSVLLATGVLLFAALDGLEGYRKAPMFFLMLLGDIVIGAIALPAWRSLRQIQEHDQRTAAIADAP